MDINVKALVKAAYKGAASIITERPLSNLYSLCENQKSIRTSALHTMLEDAGHAYKEESRDLIEYLKLSQVEIAQVKERTDFEIALKDENERLRKQLAEAKKDAGKYQELIMGVASKHPNETRHQTALRYILNAEKSSDRNEAIDNAK